MPKIAGPPLRKCTLNLFDADVQWFQDRHGQGYSEFIREVVRAHVKRHSIVERTLQRNRDEVSEIFGPQEEEG